MSILNEGIGSVIASTRWPGLVVSVGLAGLLGGCAALGLGGDSDGDVRQQDDADIAQVEADPIVVHADGDGEAQHASADELFETAYYEFQTGNYEEAAQNYQLIIDHLEGTRFYLPSLYNGGLAYERLEQWDTAVETYQIILQEFPDSDEALDAEFRLAEAHHELQMYEEVSERLTALLRRDDLEHADRVEAHIRRGRALLELEEWSDAENSFRNALESNSEVTPSEQLDDDHRLVVLAHYGRGRANHGKMNDIMLVLPPERMEQDLEDKASYHQSAQAAYIQALREHHPHWSVAAGYRIGRLYEDMYMSIFNAEVPDELTEEELALYFEELRDKLEVLMDQAMRIYERNLSLSRRLAVGNGQAEEWIEQTSLRLERMRAFLEDPLVQRRAEQLVLAQKDLDKLWDTTYYARQHVDGALQEAVGRAGVPDEELDEDDHDEETDEDDGVARR